ncbi:MAG: hypothetical protein PWQ24_732 [Mesotoga sp.]|nr:hypothetical protein [Mesotoga sp.]
MENEKLCTKLLRSESEHEVISYLEDAGYWNDPSAWKYYGDMENNFSTIGNQQRSPAAALVEKLINSVDAVLIKECLSRGIHPESSNAPSDISKALMDFFGIREGKLSNVEIYERGLLADNISLIATGDKKNPSYTIVDRGEGQYPDDFPDTFFSLNRSNKLRIPFVQGKFNMGGTGVLQFCGERNLQLVISRRHKGIVNKASDNPWGFSVVRREDPSMGIRSSTYKYLAPNDRILRFYVDSIAALPGKYPRSYIDPLESGTVIKLFDYQIGPSLRTVALLDLYNSLSLLLPEVALPIRVFERRPGYRAHSYDSVLSGLSVRLEEDKRENVEPGFPSSTRLSLMGQSMSVSVFAFKEGADEKYKKDEGIIFTVNGQTQGSLSKAFFTRNRVSLGYLANSILVIVDCSKIEGRQREDLFMNSRDRLRGGEFENAVERELEDLLKRHEGLRQLNERRRREKIEGKLQDSKPLKNLLRDVLKRSPTLSRLFIEGKQLQNPFKSSTIASEPIFEGKRFPTYFTLVGKLTEDLPKHCPIDNSTFRVKYITDAENDYFTRANDCGYFELVSPDLPIADYSVNLWNGTANLSVELPEEAEIGDLIEFNSKVFDIRETEIFESKFFVVVTEEETKSKGGNGKEQKPPSSKQKSGDDTKGPQGLNIPNVIQVHEAEWETYGFDRFDALIIRKAEEDQYDFFVNVDNWHLKTEQKGRPKSDPRILEARYEYGLVILALAMINDYREDEQGELSIENMVTRVSRAVSPFLLPMIEELGSLELSDVTLNRSDRNLSDEEP